MPPSPTEHRSPAPALLAALATVLTIAPTAVAQSNALTARSPETSLGSMSKRKGPSSVTPSDLPAESTRSSADQPAVAVTAAPVRIAQEDDPSVNWQPQSIDLEGGPVPSLAPPSSDTATTPTWQPNTNSTPAQPETPLETTDALAPFPAQASTTPPTVAPLPEQQPTPAFPVPATSTASPAAAPKASNGDPVTAVVDQPPAAASEQLLIDADALYLAGQPDAAATLYRQAKSHRSPTQAVETRIQPYTDPGQLPPAGRVYWRESAAGLDQNLQTRALVPAELMVSEIPEFVPGHLRYAEALRKYNRLEEGLTVLERAAARYGNQPTLQKELIAFQVETEKWLEASITARQFALLNPDHSEAGEFRSLADQYHNQFRKVLRRKIRGNALGGVFRGALGVALTGNPLSAVSPIHSSILLLRGEQKVGNSAARRAKKKLDLIEDQEIQAYVDRIGEKLVAVAGRPFEYEFFVVKDDQFNAFALPGGKVFVNAGAIASANSEAELAGLMAHELAHTVLSHGFQRVTDGNATSGINSLLPFGSLYGKLALTDYSQEMEKQADLLGTRMLHSAGYAADGLRNFMSDIQTETADQSKPPRWLSSHSRAKKRIQALTDVIERNGYNRYAYEGITDHRRIQALIEVAITTSEVEEQAPQPTETDAALTSQTQSSISP